MRALGAYSARYHRPFYLWSAANSWGLNEASVDPGTVAVMFNDGPLANADLGPAQWVTMNVGN